MVVKTRGMGKERIGESFHENIFLVEESRVACEVYRRHQKYSPNVQLKYFVDFQIIYDLE